MMNKSKKRELRNQALVLVFLLPIISIGTSLISGITPVSSREQGWYSYDVVYLSLGLSMFLWLLALTLTILRFFYSRKNWVMWVMEYLTLIMLLPILLGVLALNFIRPSLPDWKWLIPLILMYPAVSALPFINQGISAFLHKEIFAPKTKLGRALLWGLPAMGITGATLSQILQHIGNGVIGFAFIGLIFHFLLVWQTASFAQQIWSQYQSEKQTRLEMKDA
ncbi:MAG: hypothetical protein LC108_01650 [Anaerolineales bacterium]|nr:hypothetical protein [Anaerolineales bacterium]